MASTENETLHNLNASGDGDPRFNYTVGQTVAVMIPMCTITLMVILGNLLVIIAVLRERNLRTPQNFFLLSLAFVDFLVGIFILPLNMTNQLHGWRFPFGLTFCKVYLITDFTLCATSIYHLLAVAEDRYRIVTQGVQYIQGRSFFDVLAKLLVIYILSLWIASAPVLGWGGGSWLKDYETSHHCVMLDDPGFALFASFGCFWFPASIMLFYYVRIYNTLSGKLRLRRPTIGERSQSSEQLGPESSGSRKTLNSVATTDDARKMSSFSVNVRDFMAQKRKFSLSREKKTAKTLGIVMGAFIACWLPFTLMLNYYMICGFARVECPLFPMNVFEFITWLGYVNSALNPIIYTVFNIEFRQAFQKILHL